MWLQLLMLAAICPTGEMPVELRALDATDQPIAQAEIREWSGPQPKKRLLGVTDPDGRATVCAPRRAESLGVYLTGFVPGRVRLRGRTDSPDVRLKVAATICDVEVEQQAAPCVTGTARDGSFRFCSEDMLRLPLGR